MSELTDKEIIEGCITGDSAIRELFVRRFSNLVYVTIQGVFKVRQKSMVRDDLDDLHNSVFVSLFEKNCRKLSQYEGRNGCSLASWVRMISVRKVLDHFRKHNHGVILSDDVESLDFLSDVIENGPSPLEHLESHERRKLLETAMEKLLPRDSLVIRLHYFDELPLDQVARMMNVSPNTLYSLKSRAIHRLINLIGMDHENKINS
ncbi:MAG: sigma-70 family RNA polymerase sigma factor [Proteobacteria bacterium]|nr:sigma-70 family RNA polymerase sigma factor [Pseudomonadota bacterium]